MENVHTDPQAQAPRKLWVRLALMVLLCFAFQIAASVLFFVAVLQMIFTAATDASIPRLQSFGRSLGHYLEQIARFESFATEDAPFPMQDWPSGKE